MTPNKIITCKKSGNLYLRLSGEFDAGSAWRVLDEIKKNAEEFEIIIDTDSLNEIYPFGVHIFHQALKDLRGYSFHIWFTGKKAGEISPKGELYLNCSQHVDESNTVFRKGIF